MTVLSSVRRYDGPVASVRTDEVQLSDGTVVMRDVIEHPGAVGIVALDEFQRVCLVKQYRHPVGQELWEIPAGLRDVDGESSLGVAVREFKEEAGWRATDWTFLLKAWSSAGITDERLVIYLARGLLEVPEIERDVLTGEERTMDVAWIPLSQACDWVLEGKIQTALAVMGLLATQRLLRASGSTSV